MIRYLAIEDIKYSISKVRTIRIEWVLISLFIFDLTLTNLSKALIYW